MRVILPQAIEATPLTPLPLLGETVAGRPGVAEGRALAAIQELQELGWIGNPASSRVLHLYKFLPE